MAHLSCRTANLSTVKFCSCSATDRSSQQMKPRREVTCMIGRVLHTCLTWTMWRTSTQWTLHTKATSHILSTIVWVFLQFNVQGRYRGYWDGTFRCTSHWLVPFSLLQCNPNLQVYNVFIDNIDERIPRIALFSTRPIRAGEELTFDYKMQGKCFYSYRHFTNCSAIISFVGYISCSLTCRWWRGVLTTQRWRFTKTNQP